MWSDEQISRRLVFFEGSEYIPGDLLLGLDHIREWAMKSGLIWEAESQFVLEERIDDIAKVVRPEDELGIAIAISKQNDRLEYLEYPFLSVRSLIKRSTEVHIVYWKVIPTRWDAGGKAISYGEVKFGFWIEGCGDEFCSISTAPRVVEQFASKMDEMASRFAVQSKSQGSREMTVEGDVLATFTQRGRSFDVMLSDKEKRSNNRL